MTLIEVTEKEFKEFKRPEHDFPFTFKAGKLFERVSTVRHRWAILRKEDILAEDWEEFIS